MKSYAQRFEWIKEYRPSILRNSILIFIYKLIFGLTGLASFILGGAMIINAAVGQNIISFIIGENSNDKTPESYKALGLFLGILLIIIGIISFFIYTLAGKIGRRNNYILELEDLVSEVIAEYEEEEDADKKKDVDE